MLAELIHTEEREVMPGFRGRFVHSDQMTFAFWDIDEGSILPEHSHPHEQVAIVQEGQFELVIDGVSNIYENGKVAIIPGNAVHSGKAITPCKILDVFSPVREDYT